MRRLLHELHAALASVRIELGQWVSFWPIKLGFPPEGRVWRGWVWVTCPWTRT